MNKSENRIVLLAVLFILVICQEPFASSLKSGKTVKLPKPSIDDTRSLGTSINSMHSVRRYKERQLTVGDISNMLWAAGGTKVDGVTGASRTYPSAGACYPLEFFLVAGDIEDMNAGVYHYDIVSHDLKELKTGDMRSDMQSAAYGQSMLKNAPAIIVICAVFSRTTGRYGYRGRNYVYLDAGHAGQNIYLMASSLGLATVAVGAFDSFVLTRILDLPKIYEPIYVFPIGIPLD
ncbi:SagB/ThcOx family dehydrogenase [Elusimicrobiota bacterium]